MDENRFGTDFDIFLESPHFAFLVMSEKVGQTFLSTFLIDSWPVIERWKSSAAAYKGNMKVNLIQSASFVSSTTESLRSNQANDYLRIKAYIRRLGRSQLFVIKKLGSYQRETRPDEMCAFLFSF